MPKSKSAQKQNPNETRGTETENAELDATTTCAECGMEKSEWKGNKGRGVQKEGQAYCCQGCAEQSGCTCE